MYEQEGQEMMDSCPLSVKCKAECVTRMAQTANTLFEKSNTSEVSVHSESNGLSVAKVLNAISDDRSLSLFYYHCNFFRFRSNGQESGDGGQSYFTMNVTRRQYYQRINRLRSLGLIYRKKGRYRPSLKGTLWDPENNRNCNPESMETPQHLIRWNLRLT